MEEWGNARANAYYEAKLPRDYQKPRENDPVRVVEKFIREKYEQKRFIADSIPPPMNSSEPEPVKETRRSTTTLPTPSQSQSQSQQQQQRTSAPVASLPSKPVAPPKEEPNLLDFFDSPAPPPVSVPAPVTQVHQQVDPFQSNGFGQQQQQQQPPQQQQQNNFFSSQPVQSDPFFSNTPTQQQQQSFQDPFFGNNTQQQNQFTQAPPPPPKASADAILSLYGATPQHQTGMQQNHQAHGISMMMPPPNVHQMGMGGPPRGIPQHNPMGFGGPAPVYGNGLYPPPQQQQQQGFGHQQPFQQQGFPGGFGHQQQPLGFGQQQGFGQSYPPQGFQHQHQQQPGGFGFPQQQPQQQAGWNPNQQRGW